MSSVPLPSFRDWADTGERDAPTSVPLVLDLHGTLVRADLVWESILQYVTPAPWRAFLVLAWLVQGRAVLKARLAQVARPDLSLVPVNDDLAAFAAEEHARGRTVHLATSADRDVAAAAAMRFPFIDRVHASDGIVNLKGPAKAAHLAKALPDGFVYAGNSRADLEVWREADGIILVDASAAVARQARRIAEPIAVFPRRNRLKAAWKLARPHQWAKNALVFIPLVLGGAALDPAALGATALAFLALSLVASGTYIINDVIDLRDDRRHWTKRHRPLASGALPIPHGLALAGALLGGGFATAALAGWGVVLGTAAYLAGTLTYSFRLKRVPLVDVMTLAGLFTLRLAVGALAAGVAMSPWLLTFSMFLFLSLSLAKRHTELARAAQAGGVKAAGRGYAVKDEVVVLALGVGALVASMLVFVLYLTQEAFSAAYLAAPRLLWVFPPALFLLAARIWLLSGRGELDDDPVAFAVKDRSSLLTLAGLAGLFGLAWQGVPF